MEPAHTIQLAQAKALENVNNTIRVTLKSFTWGVDAKTVSIDIAVLGISNKRLLFAMLQYSDFAMSTDTNPYVKLNQIRNVYERVTLSDEDLSLNIGSAKSCTMANQTLFGGLAIYHANTESRSHPPNSCISSIS